MLGISQDGFPYNREGYLRPCNIDRLRIELFGGHGKNRGFEASFLSQLTQCGFKSKPTFSGPFDEQYQFSSGPISIWFAAKCRFKPFNRMVQINPSYFPSFKTLKSFMYLIVKDFDPSQTKVTTIEICIDLPIEISQLRSITHVRGYKRLDSSLALDGNMSLYFGADEQYKVYNKAKKLGLGDDCLTRIELLLEGKKLPRLSFTDLPNVSEMPLFNKTHLQEVTAPVTQKGPLNDFEVIHRLFGVEVAKRALSRNRNFRRDVEKHLITGDIISLAPYVQKSLKEFFDSGKSEYENSNPLRAQISEAPHV